jgi:hypothetical protein
MLEQSGAKLILAADAAADCDAGVFGQLTLPLFVLHYFAFGLGMACTAAGLPAGVRFSVEFGVLITIGYLMTRRLYRLYYGGEPEAPTQSVLERANLPA